MRAATIGKNSMTLILTTSMALLLACSSSVPEAMSMAAVADKPSTSQQALPSGVDFELLLHKFEDNDRYIVFDIDVNADGVLDKVISSAPNNGNELLFFENIKGHLSLVLTSINLTEDGGKVLDKIRPAAQNEDGDVLVIETYFPQGLDIAKHFVAYRDGRWLLSHTEFEISDWRADDGEFYVCDVPQDMSMDSLLVPENAAAIKQVPDEAFREAVCINRSPQMQSHSQNLRPAQQ